MTILAEVFVVLALEQCKIRNIETSAKLNCVALSVLLTYFMATVCQHSVIGMICFLGVSLLSRCDCEKQSNNLDVDGTQLSFFR